MTLREFFRTTYRPLRLRGRSANTGRLYECLFTQYGKWLAAEGIADEAGIEHLDELLLARFLEHRAATRSPYTAEKERSQLLALARLAWERRVPGLDRMPTCPPSVLPDRVPTSWTADEMRRLFAAAAEAKGVVGDVPAGLWMTCAVQLAFESGERIGALMATPASDYRRPTLMVQAGARKGGRRGRVYHLSPALCDRLDALVAYGGDKLLPWPYAATHIYNRLGTVMKKAGLSGKRMAWHQIRRTAISQIAFAGGDPVAFAGHASPAITKKWYIDPRLSERGPKPHELLPSLEPVDSSGQGPDKPAA